MLASLLRVGLIPEVYVPTEEVRSQKMLWRERIWLVRMHVRFKNRIHRLLNHYHIEVPEFSDLFGAVGRRFLEELKLREPVNRILDLRDFSVIRGSLPRRAMALVLEWSADHRDELMEEWNLLQPARNSESDRAAEVEPAIRATVPWRVASVTALPDNRLRVTFVDGTTGEVDMRRFLRIQLSMGLSSSHCGTWRPFLRYKLCWA